MGQGDRNIDLPAGQTFAPDPECVWRFAAPLRRGRLRLVVTPAP